MHKRDAVVTPADTVEIGDLVGLRVIDGVGEFISARREQWEEDARVFMLRIDGVLHAFAEDASDGYRSCLRDIVRASGDMIDGHRLVSFPPIVCNVVKCPRSGDDLIVFINERTDLCVLEIGTSDADDYYPSFVARWTPEGARLPDWLEPAS